MPSTAAVLVIASLTVAPILKLESQPSLPSVRASEVARIDARKEDFSVLGGVRESRSGDIAAAFAQDGQVRIYDGRGKRISILGQKGGGPGEFRHIGVEGWIGDTVWLYDYALQRHTFISKNGKLLRTELLATNLRPRSTNTSASFVLASFFTPHARNASGMIGVALTATKLGNAGSPARMSIVWADSEGPRRILAQIPDASARWDYPFGPWTVLAFATDGSLVGFVEVEEMQKEGASFTVRAITARGETKYALRLPYQGVEMPRRYTDSVIAKGIGIDRRRTASALRVPPIFAPVERMQFGEAGQAWVTIRDGTDSRKAILISPLGVPTAELRLPPRSEIETVSKSHIWMRETDSDGLQHLVRYAIQCGIRACE
jgi:hypothetical protein